MVRIGAAALAVAALAGCGGRSDASIDYARDSGGFLPRRVQAHIDPHGRVTATGDGCASGKGSARLPATELTRLRAVLAIARLAGVRSRFDYQAEAPDREITSGGVTRRFVGWRPLPARVQALVIELERAVSLACGGRA